MLNVSNSTICSTEPLHQNISDLKSTLKVSVLPENHVICDAVSTVYEMSLLRQGKAREKWCQTCSSRSSWYLSFHSATSERASVDVNVVLNCWCILRKNNLRQTLETPIMQSSYWGSCRLLFISSYSCARCACMALTTHWFFMIKHL